MLNTLPVDLSEGPGTSFTLDEWGAVIALFETLGQGDVKWQTDQNLDQDHEKNLLIENSNACLSAT